MAGVSKAVGIEVLKKAEEALKICERSDDISWKLKAIIAVAKFGVTQVAEIFNVNRLTVTRWINSFVAQGVDGLKTKAGRGRKSILTRDEQEQVRGWLGEDPNMTIQATQARIEVEFQKKMGKSAVHNLIKSLGFSYITPRPVHHKQDQSQQEVFKKKSTRESTTQSP